MNSDESSDYPEDWEKSCQFDGKVSVHFGYPSCGWILLSLLSTAYSRSLIIHLSEAYDPFEKMVKWLHQIAEDQLPAMFCIDEEGVQKYLTVRPYTGQFKNYSDIEFRIEGPSWNDEEGKYECACFFITRCQRQQLLGEFTKRLERWLAEDYTHGDWRYREADAGIEDPSTDLRNLDLAALKQKIWG